MSKVPRRQAPYLNHLHQNNVVNATKSPNPVLIRWNTWFKAGLYHAKHLSYYKSFGPQEIYEVCSTIQLKKLTNILADDNINFLQVELEFIKVHCE